MTTGQDIKYGDVRTVRWNLERDLTGVIDATVHVSPAVGVPPVISRAAQIEEPVTDGIVSFAILATDYGEGKLDIPAAPWQARRDYLVEVETLPGPVTHPNTGYGVLRLWRDLA